MIAEVWRDIIANFPHSVIEFFVRAVKDILADTNEYGKLRYIIRKQKTSSLGLYAAFLDGLRKELFPELVDSVQEIQRDPKLGGCRRGEAERVSLGASSGRGDHGDLQDGETKGRYDLDRQGDRENRSRAPGLPQVEA